VKRVIIIADGAADQPLLELNGLTPLEAARTPNLDALSKQARLGCAVTTPPGWVAGSDVCTMDLLGYDPVKYHTGRAPLEAASIGVPSGERDWIFRVNLVTVGERGTPEEGRMLDHSAGGISDEEARALFALLGDAWASEVPGLTGPGAFTLKHGVSYRGIFVDHGPRDYALVRTPPPHEIPGEFWAAHRPQPAGTPETAQLNAMMAVAGRVLAAHPVNAARRARGQRPANMVWIWGHGRRPSMPAFQQRFGLRGAMITAVDLLAGIAKLIGWERLDVPGVTSYHDTDYAAQGRWTIQGLADHDLVCCHVESPDEASHQADWKTKVAAIEAIDRHVVGPVFEHLRAMPAGSWRLMVLPDHYTLVRTRKHDATPVPLLIAGAGQGQRPAARFTEREAKQSGWVIDPGHTLMEQFLAV
jgi:2,3-bisphosphoglycerate-independent phosphoglycerate mutase